MGGNAIDLPPPGAAGSASRENVPLEEAEGSPPYWLPAGTVDGVVFGEVMPADNLEPLTLGTLNEFNTKPFNVPTPEPQEDTSGLRAGLTLGFGLVGAAAGTLACMRLGVREPKSLQWCTNGGMSLGVGAADALVDLFTDGEVHGARVGANMAATFALGTLGSKVAIGLGARGLGAHLASQAAVNSVGGNLSDAAVVAATGGDAQQVSDAALNVPMAVGRAALGAAGQTLVHVGAPLVGKAVSKALQKWGAGKPAESVPETTGPLTSTTEDRMPMVLERPDLRTRQVQRDEGNAFAFWPLADPSNAPQPGLCYIGGDFTHGPVIGGARKTAVDLIREHGLTPDLVREFIELGAKPTPRQEYQLRSLARVLQQYKQTRGLDPEDKLNSMRWVLAIVNFFYNKSSNPRLLNSMPAPSVGVIEEIYAEMDPITLYNFMAEGRRISRAAQEAVERLHDNLANSLTRRPDRSDADSVVEWLTAIEAFLAEQYPPRMLSHVDPRPSDPSLGFRRIANAVGDANDLRVGSRIMTAHEALTLAENEMEVGFDRIEANVQRAAQQTEVELRRINAEAVQARLQNPSKPFKGTIDLEIADQGYRVNLFRAGRRNDVMNRYVDEVTALMEKYGFVDGDISKMLNERASMKERLQTARARVAEKLPVRKELELVLLREGEPVWSLEAARRRLDSFYSDVAEMNDQEKYYGYLLQDAVDRLKSMLGFFRAVASSEAFAQPSTAELAQHIDPNTMKFIERAMRVCKMDFFSVAALVNETGVPISSQLWQNQLVKLNDLSMSDAAFGTFVQSHLRGLFH